MPCADRYTARRCSPAGSSRCRASARTTACTAGIRRSNATARRYRLSADEIVKCADTGYDLGFRTFVLQGGEDPFFTDDVLCGIIGRIRAAHPDCAVTLSFGERSRKSYERLHEAGAERYLLRHEAASPSLYRRWHPPEMSLENRMRCLSDLREIGYAVGAGFMVGAPFQTAADLACDLRFIERFQPEMCGIGPFVPHHATPFFLLRARHGGTHVLFAVDHPAHQAECAASRDHGRSARSFPMGASGESLPAPTS